MSAVNGAVTSTGNGVAAAISAGSATEAWPTPHAEIEAVMAAAAVSSPSVFKFISSPDWDSGRPGSDSVIVKYNTR